MNAKFIFSANFSPYVKPTSFDQYIELSTPFGISYSMNFDLKNHIFFSFTPFSGNGFSNVSLQRIDKV